MLTALEKRAASMLVVYNVTSDGIRREKLSADKGMEARERMGWELQKNK